MIALLTGFYRKNPLGTILLSGLFFRLISAVFSRGYGMIDDHFLVIEIAQEWVDGLNTNGWLPDAHNPDALPPGFSFLYPGFHYLLFSLLDYTGIFNPEIKMLVVRILHAFYSLWVVYFGYRIAEKIQGESCARWVGWSLALLWFMPFLSVRNLVEMACLVPLMYSTLLLVRIEKEEKQSKILPYLFAGLMGGIAFSVRFQTSLFLLGMGLVLAGRQQWKAAFYFGLGVLAAIVLVQGGIDTAVWGRPFIQLQGYVLYNQSHAFDYITGPWYNFLLIVPAALVPPMGIVLFLGWFGLWRRQAMLFWPGFLFLLFHSAFPNKQERFIFPLLPFVVIGGLVFLFSGFESQKKWPAYLKPALVFSAGLNLIFLLFISPASTRISPVDTMIFLSRLPENKCFVLESTNSHDEILLPKFYTRNWARHAELTPDYRAANFRANLPHLQACPFRYVVFREETDLKKRVLEFETQFGPLRHIQTIESSYFDRFLFWLNPKGNKIKDYFIFEKGPQNSGKHTMP
jgi:hypothetical protein